MSELTTFTVQYRESGQTTEEYIDGVNRVHVRRVFKRTHPKARILVVREN